MNAPESSPQFLARADGLRLAYRHRPGQGPTIIFLPGYMSDMEGGKAIALDAWAGEQGRAMLRLDYAGCGASEGRFEDGTLASWRDDALALIDGLTQGPLLLVGSSMGGWLALLIALARTPLTTMSLCPRTATAKKAPPLSSTSSGWHLRWCRLQQSQAAAG